MASARKFSPRYPREDLNLGPVLGEISSHPNSSLSSRQLPKQIKSERANVSLNQVQTLVKFLLNGTSNPPVEDNLTTGSRLNPVPPIDYSILITTALQCGCLPDRCPAYLPGPANYRVHWPCQGAARIRPGITSQAPKQPMSCPVPESSSCYTTDKVIVFCKYLHLQMLKPVLSARLLAIFLINLS